MSKESIQPLPITNQPAAQLNDLQNPPPYTVSQQMQGASEQQLIVMAQQPGIQLQVLDGLDKFFIVKTGKTTRTAQDSSKSPLFHYTESLIAMNQTSIRANIVFNDNSGYQFLIAEISLSGIRVQSGTGVLGVMDTLSHCMSTWKGSSSLGLGKISFVGKGGIPCLFCVCCTCSCGRRSFSIKLDNEEVGEVRSNSSEGTVVEFNRELDSRIKALFVVGGFVLYNAFWR